MAQSKLWQYAVIFHPKPVADASGNVNTDKSVLVIDMTRVLAKDVKEVTILASRAIPEEYADKADRLEFVINILSQ